MLRHADCQPLFVFGFLTILPSPSLYISLQQYLQKSHPWLFEQMHVLAGVQHDSTTFDFDGGLVDQWHCDSSSFWQCSTTYGGRCRHLASAVVRSCKQHCTPSRYGHSWRGCQVLSLGSLEIEGFESFSCCFCWVGDWQLITWQVLIGCTVYCILEFYAKYWFMFDSCLFTVWCSQAWSHV